MLLERIKLLEKVRTVAAANSLTAMLAYEDATAKIKKLEEELMEVRNKYAVLVADVVLNEDRAERIKRLEEAGNDMVTEEDVFIRLKIWMKAKEDKESK